MYTIADATSTIETLFSGTSSILSYVLPVVIATALAIVGLGFGWRMLKKHVLGRKF